MRKITRASCALWKKEKHTQSNFEREVVKRLTAAGYRVTPPGRLELSGSIWSLKATVSAWLSNAAETATTPSEKLPEDMDRQSVLERMGWIFTRIRSSEFLRNPARAMKPVFEKLQMLEIPPTGDSTDAEPAQPTSREAIDCIVRRAEELRRNWSKTNGAGARSSSRASAAAAV